jgi:hypothetical protein
MGVWGAGLYSSDFAKDLSSAARAVARLPYDADRLAEIVCSVEPGAAANPADEDHTTFWLVLADQFAKKGIACERVRQKAIAIIDNGDDLAMLSKLGMDAAGLKKRGRMLAELRKSIADATAPARPRKILKKPQELLMRAGDVLVYPTAGGKIINPYVASLEKMVPEWRQDGWGAAVIVETGRSFGFLAWYRPLTIAMMTTEKPGIEELLSNSGWVLKRAGTCSAAHFRKMRLEKAGTVSIDQEKLDRCFANRPDGMNEAVNDISIANRLDVGPALKGVSFSFVGDQANPRIGRPYPAIRNLKEILV